MVDIESIKKEIVQRLKPLEPDKIILFGSYAYGEPNEESDIDIFLIKDIRKKELRNYALMAKKLLRDLVFEKNIGFDVFADSVDRMNYRINFVKDQFYDEILHRGKILYEK